MKPTGRKSSRSASQGDCVEVADLRTVVAVRDSTDPHGPVLAFPRAEWRRFVAGLAAR